MPSQVYLRDAHHPGGEITLECPSPSSPFLTIFEDDGETGTFYGLRQEFGAGTAADAESELDNPILYALPLYRVEDVEDREQPFTVEIVWSEDGLKSALYLDGSPRAVIDFDSGASFRRCFTSTPASGDPDEEWDDRALDFFR